ncbi:exported protein (PHISTa) [Plasmodium reichenowi]|uniref:Exported protein (PHISTa) n=1 Tax=Plasmodium reichenowi TaxID=5854 RepID=A0A151L657_PLARE|nr:exported protein (PHISTa) [Plasmodium reichenowi]KYN94454.1 exported protein (PHISTa) [Plasmodium reichenowi]
MKLLTEMNHIFFIYKILYMLKNNDIFTLYIENYKKKKRKHSYKISIFTYLLIFIVSISFINLMTLYENRIFSSIHFNNKYARILDDRENDYYSSLKRINSKNNIRNKKDDESRNLHNNMNKNNMGNYDMSKNDIYIHNKHNDSGYISKNESNDSLYLNYNDTTKPLTKEQLFEIINALKEIPSDEDLENIWKHTISVAKEGLGHMIKKLYFYLDGYMDEYEEMQKQKCFCFRKEISEDFMDEINETLLSHEKAYTYKFYKLIRKKRTVEKLKNFIFTFIDKMEKIINYLYHKHKGIYIMKVLKLHKLI